MILRISGNGSYLLFNHNTASNAQLAKRG